MDTNQTAAAVKSGQADELELWAAVRRFALQQARRWVYLGRGGVTIEDLEQAAFLALLAALADWQQAEGNFLTWYGFKLKEAFATATGQRTKRTRSDPLDTAASIDAPLDEREGGPLTLADVIPDPQATEALEHIGEWDALHSAVKALPEAQQAAILGRYWFGQKVDNKAHAAALRALRHPSVSRTLRAYP